MTYSIIKKSQLEGAQRIDAEYYQPEYLGIDKIISDSNFKTINDLSEKVFSGPFGSTLKSESYQAEGIPFIRIGDISDVFINKDNLVFISPKEHRRIYSTHLEPGDIVFSKIGTVGRLSIISDELGEVNISENNIGIRISSLNPEQKAYLLFFLLSKYGQLQILRKGSGNIQQKINVVDIENIKVPLWKGEFFDEIWRKIKNQRYLSLQFYQQAEDLLLEELGLKDFKLENELFAVVDYSTVETANRTDAEFYQTKYQKLKDGLEGKIKPLISLVEAVRPNFDPINTPDKEFRYVELANINSSNGLIDGYEAVLGKEAPSRAKRILKTGDVIVSSVEGSLDKVALVSKDQEGYLASTGFFQFRSGSIAPEVLLVLMKSIVMQWQLKQHCAGTILTAVPAEALSKIYIPQVSSSVSGQIVNFVVTSHTTRRKSKELLEQAKEKVETSIVRQAHYK